MYSKVSTLAYQEISGVLLQVGHIRSIVKERLLDQETGKAGCDLPADECSYGRTV